MMRMLAVVLLLGILLQICSKQLIYTDYLVNKDFVARVLCINKDMPEKHCEGKCHLKKQLDKDSRQQESGNQKSKPGAEVVYLFPQSMVIKKAAVEVRKHYFYYQQFSECNFIASVFQPPGVFNCC